MNAASSPAAVAPADFWTGVMRWGQMGQTTGESADAYFARLHAPPQWFQTLCADLHSRSTADGFDELARASAAVDPSTNSALHGGAETARANAAFYRNDHVTLSRPAGSIAERLSDAATGGDGASQEGLVDPYLWLEFTLLPEEQYEFIGPEGYTFPEGSPYDEEARRVLGGAPSRDGGPSYVCFCHSYRFPERQQLPTSVGTAPSKLWVRPDTPGVVFIQLGDDVPPGLWLPARATAGAIRRILAEFAQTAATHRALHEAQWEQRWSTAVRTMRQQRQLPPETSPDARDAHMLAPEEGAAVLRHLGWQATTSPFDGELVAEFHNSQELFVGEYDDPEAFQQHADLCPVLFAVPDFRTTVNLFDKAQIPTALGPGVATSLYRTRYSKSLLLVQTLLSAEVKLPPLDPEGFALLWDETPIPASAKSRVPIFVRAIWPDNTKMCAGGALLPELNASFKRPLEFAKDMPVDVAHALLYLSHWVGRPQELLGIRGMRRRVLQLEREQRALVALQVSRAAALPPPAGVKTEASTDGSLITMENLGTALQSVPGSAAGVMGPYPGSADIPSPAYSIEERLGMHLQYAAFLRDPEVGRLIDLYMRHPHAGVRLGCAKAALISGDRARFHAITSAEPEGRMRRVMTNIVRKRKARDLTDPEHRWAPEQFEFAAPVWAGKRRIDPATAGGQRVLSVMKQRGAALNKSRAITSRGINSEFR